VANTLVERAVIGVAVVLMCVVVMVVAARTPCFYGWAEVIKTIAGWAVTGAGVFLCVVFIVAAIVSALGW